MNNRDRAKETALREMLTSMSKAKPKEISPKKSRVARKAAAMSIPESYELVVTCRDENDQRQLYERLAAEGYECRVLTM